MKPLFTRLPALAILKSIITRNIHAPLFRPLLSFGLFSLPIFAAAQILNTGDTVGPGPLYTLTNGDVLQNTGTIASTTGNAIEVFTGSADINNSLNALIKSTSSGIQIYYGAATIENSGTIVGGIDTNPSGTPTTVINNTGAFVQGLVSLDAGGVVANAGTIISGANGVSADKSLTVSNTTTGLIQGDRHGISFDFGGPEQSHTVANSGTIAGINGSGINADIHSGPVTITNDATGLIQGNERSIYLNRGGAIANSGTIASTTTAFYTYGIRADSPVFLSNNADARIQGGYICIFLNSGGTVTNAGFIEGHHQGVAIDNGAMVANSGTIIGMTYVGVYTYGATTLVINEADGLIQGGSFGVQLTAGGTVANSGAIDGANSAGVYASATSTNIIVNANTGLIQGNYGVWLMENGAIANSGTIIGTTTNSYGIRANRSAFVTNAAASLIQGEASGIRLYNSGTIINSGSITATSNLGFGIDSGTTALVINETTGLIHGRQYGINFDNSGTVVNSGTIISDHSSAVFSTLGSAPVTITNKAGSNITGFGAIWLNGGGTIANAGIITGTSFNPHARIYAQGGLASLLNTGTINGNVMLIEAAPNAVTLAPGSLIAGNLKITGSAATLTLDGAANTAQLYSAAVTGSTIFSGTLIKTGAGLWRIDAPIPANLTGFEPQATIVQSGTLVISHNQPLPFLANNGAIRLGDENTAGAKLRLTGPLIASPGSSITLNIVAHDNITISDQIVIANTSGISGATRILIHFTDYRTDWTRPISDLAPLIIAESGTLTPGMFVLDDGRGYERVVLSQRDYVLGYTNRGIELTAASSAEMPFFTAAQELKTALETPGTGTIAVSAPVILALVGSATISSGKTIIGEDAGASIIGNLVIPANATDIVITGVSFVGGELVISGAKDIDISHCTFTDTPVSISGNADNISFSWNKFTANTSGSAIIIDHTDSYNRTYSIALDPIGEGVCISINNTIFTLAHNLWSDNLISAMIIDNAGASTGILLHHNLWDEGLRSHMPNATNARAFMFNNYFIATGNTSATIVGAGAQILSSRNIYQGTNNPLTKQSTGLLRTLDNFMMATTGTIALGNDTVFVPAYSHLMHPAGSTPPFTAAVVADLVTIHAGNTDGKNSITPSSSVTNGEARITAPAASVSVGSSLTLTANATGFTPTARQWYRDNFPLAGATGNTHTVTNAIAATDAGAYSVALTTPAGEIVTSAAFTVTVTANSGAGGGGGGATSLWCLTAIAALLALRGAKSAKRN